MDSRSVTMSTENIYTEDNSGVADGSSWADIIAPFDCNKVIVSNESDGRLKTRRDKEDPKTESILEPQDQKIFGDLSPVSRHMWGTINRFIAGSIIASAQSTDGTASYHVIFQR